MEICLWRPCRQRLACSRCKESGLTATPHRTRTPAECSSNTLQRIIIITTKHRNLVSWKCTECLTHVWYQQDHNAATSCYGRRNATIIFPNTIFPDIPPTFPIFHDFSLTSSKFPDISRLSRQVVTPNMQARQQRQCSITSWRNDVVCLRTGIKCGRQKCVTSCMCESTSTSNGLQRRIHNTYTGPTQWCQQRH